MKQNGRIKLLDTPNPMTLYDKIRPSTATYHEAMTSNWTDTPLSKLFFSTQNQQLLQNGIRAGVYRASAGKMVIAQQPVEELKMVMRGIFLQYSVNQPGNVTTQIKRLNEIIFAFSIPQIYGEAKGYITYLHDASTLVVPLSNPINSVSYDKTLELKPFF